MQVHFRKVRFILPELLHRKKKKKKKKRLAPLCDSPRSCEQADEEVLTEDSLKIHI